MRSKIGLKYISLPESIVNKLKSDEDLEIALSSISVLSTNVNEQYSSGITITIIIKLISLNVNFNNCTQ